MKNQLSEKTREAKVRRMLKAQGLTLQKSRCRTPESPDYGGYMISDVTNCIVGGGYPNVYSMSLEDVERFAAE